MECHVCGEEFSNDRGFQLMDFYTTKPNRPYVHFYCSGHCLKKDVDDFVFRLEADLIINENERKQLAELEGEA